MAVLVGKEAPDFTAAAVMPDNSINDHFNLRQYANGQYIVLFFYPKDFTFVCPTEIIAFNNRLKDFQDRNTVVVSVSGDNEFTHLAWKNTAIDKGGVGNLQFPMVADLSHAIARNYDVLYNEEVALRGTFLIDRSFVIRHQVINDLPLGRNIDEAVRMVDALQFFEENGEVCPAGWHKGEAGMQATPQGVAQYLGGHAQEL
jgi:peroxiredoxin 2/4